MLTVTSQNGSRAARRPGSGRTAFVAGLAFLALHVFASPAAADVDVCGGGSAAGQCQNPAGLAVDSSTGRLYVADAGNNRIDVFEASGAFVMAFGWGVKPGDTPASGFGICTTVTGCQAGFAGPGRGQISSPERIAVDSATHSVYVSETENHRAQKFDASGSFLFMIGKEVNKTAVEEGRTAELNVCPAPGHPADVCQAGGVGEGEGQFLSTFSDGLPVAVGPGGVLHVADSKTVGFELYNTRVQRFDPVSGASLGQLLLPGTTRRVRDITVDSMGSIYVASEIAPGFPESGGVAKFHSDGTSFGSPYPLLDLERGSVFALAVDGSDNLFFTVRDKDFNSAVFAYTPTGTQQRAIYGDGPLQENGLGLAVYHTAQGDLFVSQADGVQYLPFPPPGPVVLAKSCAASAITAAKATLTCNVNPEGKASSFHYEYVDDATYQADLPNGFEHAHSSAEQPLLGAADFSLREAEAKLPAESLAPETEYHFRIVATNADAPGGNPGEEATFLTKGGAEVLDTWATEVGSDSARGHAEVDPVGLATTGRFQYVDEVSYESEGGFASPHTQTTGGQIHFGNGEGGASGSTQLHSLQPGTTYRYRLVAEDPFGNQVFGPERALHTFAPVPNETACPNQALRSGPAAALPDCRAYEMVSPLDKDGADVITRINVTGFQTELAQSATDGSAFTYSSYRAFADPQGAPFTNQYLAERGKAGWLTASLSPPRDGGSFRDDLENSYKAFSADLSHSWLLQEGEPTLDPCAPVGFANLYRRDGDGAFHALSCAAPPNLEAVEFSPEIEGFSADGEVAVFRVNDALEVDEGPQASAATVNESGAPRPIYQTYVSSDAGELRLVSVLPDGLPSDKDSSAGTGLNNDVVNHHRQQSLAGAVSNDGERVFWTAGTGSGALYLRENATAPQSESGACDEDGKACTQPVSGLLTSSPAYFQQANPQGTKALFTVEAGPLEDNLYRFDVESGGPPELIAEGVIGHILGASEGLSRVYLASTKASPQAEAEGAAPGKPNVYLDEEGQSRFIGTLSGPGRYSDIDPNVGGYGSPIAPSSGVATPKPPIEHTAQASADGQSLVFMSNSPELSAQSAGYDNADAATGTPDTEVFLYDATADGGQGALRCLSCNPGGGRPEGREIAPGENNKPGPFGAATIPLADNDLYRPRYLSSDGGRVFFESFEALVLADTNGAADVYQWEEAGSGACTGKGASYVPASEGCLSLISSGKSPSDSRLLDASASGSDVFFTTAEGLLPGDYGLVDVYDARVNGGFPPPPPPPPACEGDACQGPVTSRDDPTPASASFQGAGDRSERGRRSSRCPAGKRRVRKAGRGRCVKRQRARKDQRRQTHDRRRISR